MTVSRYVASRVLRVGIATRVHVLDNRYIHGWPDECPTTTTMREDEQGEILSIGRTPP
jgi:hypothetical protein